MNDSDNFVFKTSAAIGFTLSAAALAAIAFGWLLYLACRRWPTLESAAMLLGAALLAAAAVIVARDLSAGGR